MSCDEARHGKALLGMLERYLAVENTVEAASTAASNVVNKVSNALNELLK